jgi:hypothetical protein
MFAEKKQIENRINQLKMELMKIVEKTGLNSTATLCCSQELDQLITYVMKSQKVS